MIRLLIVFWCLASSVLAHHQAPPYDGTVFVNPPIITKDDPSALVAVLYVQKEQRETYDHRVEDWQWAKFYRFDASYPGQVKTRFYVNREFSKARAEQVAKAYAFILGQMPKILRDPVREAHVHETGEDWSANSEDENIIIHHGAWAEEYPAGYLEEAMMHETVHVALDPKHAESNGWYDAQDADDVFVSIYAEENPDTEDLAEFFPLYYAWAVTPDRLSEEVYETIDSMFPARLDYLSKHFPKEILGL